METAWQYLQGLSHGPGATDNAITEAERQLGLKFPAEYVEFLKIANGGEGFIGKGAYAMLWCIQELASMNRAYEVQKNAPGLLIFGSDGGGEAYGFDTRDPHWPIVQVPFIGMDWRSAQPLGDTFASFLKHLHDGEYE